jgi:hypothetical protein
VLWVSRSGFARRTPHTEHHLDTEHGIDTATKPIATRTHLHTANAGRSHSAATHLGEANAGLQLIMAKGRWRNPRMAMRYVKPGGEAVAEVTELLDIAPPRRG